MRTGLISSALLLATLAIPRAAAACSCIVSGPECQAYWKTDAVFDATVLRITPIGRVETIGGREVTLGEKLVTLQVHRAWKGAQPGEIDVVTSSGGGMCGYDFKEGQRYLVFAHQGRAGGRLGVSSCSLTQPFDGTGRAADFLASLQRPAAGARVFGTVRTWYRTFDYTRPRNESPTETTVRLIGAGRDVSTKSSGGKYEFAGLPEGSYRVEIEVPAGHRTYGPTREVALPNTRACAEETFSLTAAGRIVGRLLGSDGSVVGEVRVEVTSPEARPDSVRGMPMQSARTDEHGFFELTELPPGRYIVGLNLAGSPNRYNPYLRTVYPGAGLEPQVIALALGQTIDLGTWQIPPPVPFVRVAGIVIRADGTPVADVWVGALDRTGDAENKPRSAGSATSGPDGTFVLQLRQGRTYTFTARPRQGKPFRIKAPQLELQESPRNVIQIVIDDGANHAPTPDPRPPF